MLRFFSSQLLTPRLLASLWIPLALGAICAVVLMLSGAGSEIITRLGAWDGIDSWIVATGALAAMACAVPGCFLVVRKLSMMGDAISHAALPGIVLGFLAAQYLRGLGWLTDSGYEASRHLILLSGAILLGILCSLGTELVQRWGHVESSAALGVVFTTLFALGLLLLRLTADDVDLDPDCVLYGTLENVVLDRIGEVPRAAVVNGGMLVFNVLLVGLLFKEFRISAFDPRLAQAMGFPAGVLHYVLMAVTAATLVAAFESVGSILVVAMLIVPPATALLLTDRLGWMVVWSVMIAAFSAILGHALAVTLPPVIFRRLGYSQVVDASTAGMMAAASGLLFLLAMLFGPRYGLVTRLIDRWLLALSMAGEDILGLLYRVAERSRPTAACAHNHLRRELAHLGWLRFRVALRTLVWQGHIQVSVDGWRLTESGRAAAQQVVRGHRLWESYLAKHYPVEDARLHESASRAEHFIDAKLRERLAAELNAPRRDPHGSVIPDESS